MTLSALRAEAVTAVHAVREALRVLRAREGGDRLITKGGLDLATGTDLRSQEVIRDLLERAHPEHAFVGEESGADVAPRSGSYWLVDPLCGTRNFAYRIPLYSVNVALVEDHQVTVAAVGDGAHGDVWVASHGQGAWLAKNGHLERARASDSSAMVVFDRGRPGGPAADKAVRVVAAALRDPRWEVRTLGSSLDLAYLAAGRLAAVWHFSRIAPLHFAAGTLLATEAGAVVTDDRGDSWTLATSEGLVAAATPRASRSAARAPLGPEGVNGSTIDALVTLPDAALPRRGDTPEGPRSIQFFLYSALRREQAAAAVVKWRTQSAAALAQAQSALRELEAVLAGRPDALLDSLRDGEWTLRDLLRHVIAVELRYAAQVEYSATRANEDPVAIPEDRLPCDRLSPPEKEFGDSKTGDIRRLLDLMALARERSDRQLADLPDDALGRPSRWGQIEIDVRERLHQMGVHIVEATIQTEKMLGLAGEGQGEARAIVRRILRARGLHERETARNVLAQLDAALDRLSPYPTS